LNPRGLKAKQETNSEPEKYAADYEL